MPVWIRRFTYRSIENHFLKIKEQTNKITSPKKQTLGPNIQPSFTSKGSRK